MSLLYYELQRSPRQAFEGYYLRWDDIAIRGREYELDIQLRNELLRFFSFSINEQRATKQGLPPAEIDQASAIRWVKRFVHHSNYQQAIDLAETLLALGPKTYSTIAPESVTRLSDEEREKAQKMLEDANPFFWGQLLAYYGDALVFTGAEKTRVEEILNEAINLLKSEKFDKEEPLAWLQERVLGRAFSILGYLFRSYGHYSKAVDAYHKALEYFEDFELADERATTQNNLSFLLALLGDLREAKEYVDKALNIRQRLGQRYPLALSYNTRGLIYALRGKNDWARRECEFALRIFQDMGSQRGIGLAFSALGFILRQQGDSWKTNQCNEEQATISFQQSADYLKQAEEIFTEQVDEPIRLWEALNELGSLYCDWGFLLKQQESESSSAKKRNRAIQYHLEAYKVAQEHGLQFQQADTCDDLAQVFADQGNMDQANEWLNKAVDLVPAHYTIKPDVGIQKDTEAGDFYWLVLGKANLQQGIWLMKRVANNSNNTDSLNEAIQGINHFALATIYFSQYWSDSNYLEQKLQTMARYINGTGMSFEKIKAEIDKSVLHYMMDLRVLIEAVKNDLVDRPGYF